MARERTKEPPPSRAVVKAGDEVEALIDDWAKERPDVDMGSLRVFLPLRRAMQHAEARRAEVLARHGVTPAMLDMLVVLRRGGPPYVCTPSDLARQLVLSAGGVSQRLERLEQSGLIERTVNTDDRRGVHVRLTKAGIVALDKLIGEYMAHEEQLLQRLPGKERDRLAAMLLRLNTSISSSDEVP